MGSRWVLIIICLFLLVPSLSVSDANGVTRGTGGGNGAEEPQDGWAPDGYYNKSIEEKLTYDWIESRHYNSPDGDHHIANVITDDLGRSVIFYSRYSFDLDEEVLGRIVYHGTYCKVIGLGLHRDSIHIFFIDWRSSDNDTIFYPDLLLVKLDPNQLKISHPIIIMRNFSRSFVRDRYDHIPSTLFRFSLSPDCTSHVIVPYEGSITYRAFDVGG
jgi:hypothetical protein